MKKALMCIVALIIVILFIPKDGNAAGKTIKISSAKGLAEIAKNPDADYVLTCDISMKGMDWKPIYKFSGTLDGKGYTISGLTINASNSENKLLRVGLFEVLGGTVKNLKLSDIDILVSGEHIEINLFGYSNWEPYPYDLETVNPEQFPVQNCEISGEIRGSGKSVTVYGLLNAYASVSKMNYFCEYDSDNNDRLDFWTVHPLQQCRDCENNGSATGVSTSSYVFDNCISCVNTGNFEMPYTNFYYYVFKDAKKCINRGRISAPAIIIFDNSQDCENMGSLIGDKISLCDNYSQNCVNRGDMRDFGKIDQVSFDLRGNNNKRENVNLGAVKYTGAYGTALEYFKVYDNFCEYDHPEYLILKKKNLQKLLKYNVSAREVSYTISGKTGTILNQDIEIVQTTGVCELLSLNMGLLDYNYGNISITVAGAEDTQSGNPTNVKINCAAHNMGDISLRINCIKYIDVDFGRYNSGNVNVNISDTEENYVYFTNDWMSGYNSGNISLDGSGFTSAIFEWYANYNAGDIKVSGAKYIKTNGISRYNTGDINIHNAGSVEITGSYYNEGDITINADGKVKIIGGTKYNGGDIIVESNGKIEAYGAKGSDITANFGDVSAYSTNESVSAYGALEGFNSGKITARSDGENVSVSARAQNGSAEAYGNDVPSAEGVQCKAINVKYNVVASNGENAYDSKGGLACISRIPSSYVEEPEIQKPEFEVPDIPDPPVYNPDDEDSVSFTFSTSLSYEEYKQHYVVESFEYACGSLLFGAEDCSELTLTLHITAGTEALEKPVIFLPWGFSFEPYEMVETKTIDYIIPSGQSFEYSETIYPIYFEDMLTIVRFSLNGIGEKKGYSVKRVEDENVVLCRNTKWVSNLHEDQPIEIKTSVDYADAFLRTAPDQFNQKLNELGCALTQAVYVDDFIIDSLHRQGFSNIRFYDGLDYNDVGCAIAQKKVMKDGEIENILMVVVRGTLGYEWIGNFLVVNDSYPNEHANFRGAANSTMQRITHYCTIMGIEREYTQAFLCGHSRAAAAIDLLAHDLNISGDFVKELRAYTYATPNSTKNPSYDGNIFNIMFLHDVVAYVPNGYEKHGQTIVMGTTDIYEPAPINVKSLFKEYSGGKSYSLPNQPVLIGLLLRSSEALNQFMSTKAVSEFMAGHMLTWPSSSDVPVAHGAEGYLAWVFGNGMKDIMSLETAKAYLIDESKDEVLANEIWLSIFRINGFKKAAELKEGLSFTIKSHMIFRHGLNILNISCPVDVEVLDASGSGVACIENHSAKWYAPEKIHTISIEDTDLLLIPRDAGYTVRITGNSGGDMDIGYVQIAEGMQVQMSANAYYTKVPLNEGETYQMVFAPAGSLNEWVLYGPDGNVYDPDKIQNGIYLPVLLKRIEAEAYIDCVNLTGTIICPEGMISIGEAAFKDSGITGILLPDSVQEIAADAFENISPVIYCSEGSYAYNYALENGLTIEILDK